MELSPLIESIREDLAAAADLGDEHVRGAANRLGRALEAALRVRLLDALTIAAYEVSSQLGSGAVELRLAGDTVELAVTRGEPEPSPPAAGEDEGTARLTLRLPEGLKARAEQAAAHEGMSTNAWLVRAVATGLADRSSPRVGRRLRGFAES
jgi:HicB family